MRRAFRAVSRGCVGAAILSGSLAAHGQAPGYSLPPTMMAAGQQREYIPAQPYSYPASQAGTAYSPHTPSPYGAAEAYAAPQYTASHYSAQSYPAQQQPAQQQPAQSYPAQQYAAQPYAGAAYAGQTYASQPNTAYPYPAQQYVAQQPADQPTAPPVYSGTPAHMSPVGPPCYTTPGCDYGAPCADYGCAPQANCAPPACWTVHGGALLFFQDNENHHTFSFDSAIESNQLVDWGGLEADFLPGFEVGLTRFDCCTMTGWEGLYWGLFPSDSSVSAFDTSVTGNLDPILDFSQLNYNGGPADASTNSAVVHRLRRSSEFHNAELNRLWGVPVAGDSLWNVRTLAGFRFFRMEEALEFATDANDGALTGELDELYYTIDTENNLYGLQLGGSVERRAWGRLGLTAGAKAGVFCNDASAHSRIGGAAGTATVNNGPNSGRLWDITSEKEDVAFLAEVQAGLTYQIGARWKAFGQYRVLGVSGVALPANQIYHDLRGVNDVELLGTNGSLLLHGVFVGAERVF